MPSLWDVSVLFALAYRKHASHRQAAGWLEQIDDGAAVAICRHTQMGLLRLLSNRAVMNDDVLDTPHCWAVFDTLMTDQRFVFMTEPPEMDTVFRHVMSRSSSSPQLWQDAYLAAFAMTAGLSFVTFDRAFKQFEKLDLVLLG
jgi:uncharacterized protein